jgi:hypothetical protein
MGPDTVNGNVNADGNVTLSFSSPDAYPYDRYPYVYKAMDSGGHKSFFGPDLFLYGVTLILIRSDPPNVVPINVPIYSYSLSPTTLGLVKVVDGHDVVDVGKIVVDSVDKLLLVSETAAAGNFKWHRDYNKIGAALNGTNKQEGVGRVSFGKQPDGTWVITEVYI